MQSFMSDRDVTARILDHIKNKTTDRGQTVWTEPAENYRSADRFEQELALFRAVPTPFCPATALSKPGDYIARRAGMTPLIVVRGQDGKIRAFKTPAATAVRNSLTAKAARARSCVPITAGLTAWTARFSACRMQMDSRT